MHLLSMKRNVIIASILLSAFAIRDAYAWESLQLFGNNTHERIYDGAR